MNGGGAAGGPLRAGRLQMDKPAKLAPKTRAPMDKPRMRELGPPKEPMGFKPKPRGAPAAGYSPAAAAGYSPVSPQMWGGPRASGKRTTTTEELKGMVESVMSTRSRSAQMDVWGEDKGGVSIAGIDRTETLMKKAFDEYRRSMATRTTASPLAALQAIFRNLDMNHSGRIDLNEFMALPRALGFQANQTSLKALFERYDLNHSGLLNADEFCRMMWKPEGDVGARAKTVIGKMREVLLYRTGGFPSMQAMGRQFRIIDRDNSGQLDKEEMDIMLTNFFNFCGIKFSPEEKKALFTFFDKKGTGEISYDEFIRAVRGDMNVFREDLVKKAFAILDTDGSGQITKDEIMAKYDVSKNPNVMSGRESPGEAYTVFMNTYDTDSDGIITMDEFIEGYQWISASIDHDDYFELMMRNAWHMAGGEGWCANTTNLAVLVTYHDGRQEVVQLMDDLGLDKFDDRAVLQRLHQQGCRNIQRIELYGGMEV
mmetsp:Transcript_88430/g.169525  ORF Transcript_88430/g.169525 Transcript_88430/m.169525 type:complete len:483 (-) Transcript_88430:43-1491(-)